MTIRRFGRAKAGSAVVEYGLIAGLIGLALVIAITQSGAEQSPGPAAPAAN